MSHPMPPELPRHSWFHMQPPSALHGAGHTARVMVWAAVLTRGTEWFEPVVWAAACHDLRRVNDGDDLPHGFRAGGWVRQVLPGKLRQPLPCLELIASACDWHVCADEDAEWDHPVLWWLKDADGLDRVRLFDLDPRYLRHAETHPWVPAATRLYQATSDLQDAPLIWEKAGALDIPVRELIAFVREQVETRLKPEPEAPKTPVRPARGW